jgi:hypothetical protein
MTITLNLPPEIETSLETRAAERGLPLEIYLERFLEHAFSTKPTEPEGNLDRRSFLKLPLAERRRILAAQAEKLAPFYEQTSDWKEWLEGDLVEY